MTIHQQARKTANDLRLIAEELETSASTVIRGSSMEQFVERHEKEVLQVLVMLKHRRGWSGVGYWLSASDPTICVGEMK